MKDIFKGVSIKVISTIVIVALVLVGGYFGVKAYIDSKIKLGSETDVAITDVLEERLQLAAELNTANYICTYVQEYTDQHTLNGWKIPFTDKKFTISYEGTVEAGIANLSEAVVYQKDENTIVVQLPQVEITGYEIDKDSLQIYNESHNILNQIEVADVNEAQKNLEQEMIARAEEYGLLDTAKENAETIIKSMLSGSTDLTIEIQWK